MKISVFGLGYTGTVTAGHFAAFGHDVTAVDISQTKIDLINAQRSPIYESGMDELIAEAVGSGRLRATFDARGALLDSEISFVAVGTPSMEDGRIDTTYIRRVCAKLGQVFANKDGFHTFVIRSTIIPGMTEEMIVPIIEENSGKKVFVDFDICVNPHFLRQGSLVEDFRNPPFTLIGQAVDGVGDRVARLYSNVNAPVKRTSIRTAEMVKYAGDAFHGLKICFADEIGAISKRLGIDSHEVMDIFCMDGKANISSMYLRPGAPFGGPNIARNIRALIGCSGLASSEVPLLSSVPVSNDAHAKRVLDAVLRTGKKRIGIFGLAFKPGTDDLRESPMVELTASLIANGLEVLVYDKAVSPARLIDLNKEYIDNKIPGVEAILVGSFDDIYSWSDVLVIAHGDDDIEYLATMDTDKIIIDLARIARDVSDCGENYDGIGW